MQKALLDPVAGAGVPAQAGLAHRQKRGGGVEAAVVGEGEGLVAEGGVGDADAGGEADLGAGMQAGGAAEGARLVVVAVGADPVRAALDAVKRAAGDDLRAAGPVALERVRDVDLTLIR